MSDFGPKLVPPKFEPASRKEIFAWAMYDFANSSYGTIIATAVYSAYFVAEVAGKAPGIDEATATLLLTWTISLASLLIVISAPVIGAIADAKANKKHVLLISTVVLAIFTALLAVAGPGQVWLAMALLIVANVAFGTGEDLIAAFLPEIAKKDDMGKVSAFGWTVGYVGGLTILGLAFTFITWAQKQGMQSPQYVPIVLGMTAIVFALASVPTFLFLKERAEPDRTIQGQSYFRVALERLSTTLSHAGHYRDLAKFLVTLFLYSCGTTTVVTLSAVYAQDVLGFTTRDNVALILVVNITAAVGAFVFGFVQDKIGSVKTLAISLSIWLASTMLAFFVPDKNMFWVVANLVGIAMGSSASAGRALVGQLSPEGRSAEFFGLWGLVVKLATAVGPLTYGVVKMATGNNSRLALLSTACYFLLSIFMLLTVNEKRGRIAASMDPEGKA